MTQWHGEDVATKLLDAAKKAGADAADVMVMESVDLSVACRLGNQEELERSEQTDMGLRVWSGDRQAIVSTTDMAMGDAKMLAERAVAMAKVATSDPHVKQATKDQYATEWEDLDLYDDTFPEAVELYDMAIEAEDTARAVKGITNSEGAEASASAYRLVLATSEGFKGAHRASSYSISASMLAGEGEHMQTDYDYSLSRHFADLDSPADIGRRASENALERMHPKKVESCMVPVVFDPRVSKSLVGTFASAISGSSVARGTSFLKDKMGEELFDSSVMIVDDPLMKRGMASRPFDGEGMASRPMNLVEKGKLTSWLLDIRTASLLHMETTGHASRGFASPPSPAPSNLYMETGSLTPEQLIKEVGTGFYVNEAFGMGINTTTGEYSQGASGFWIENGEIAYPVSEVTIAGKLLDMFKGATPANDLTFKYSTNCPTLRVDGMTIAGS